MAKIIKTVDTGSQTATRTETQTNLDEVIRKETRTHLHPKPTTAQSKMASKDKSKKKTEK